MRVPKGYGPKVVRPGAGQKWSPFLGHFWEAKSGQKWSGPKVVGPEVVSADVFRQLAFARAREVPLTMKWQVFLAWERCWTGGGTLGAVRDMVSHRL